MSSNRYAIVRRSGLAALALAALTTGCTVDKSSAPSLSAPSGFGLSLTSSASPDVLPRDGQSTSTIQFTVRDFQDTVVKGQRLTLATTAGTLSAGDVTTDSAGVATVQFTAPAANQQVTSATITATPVGTDLGTVTSGSRTVVVTLAGPAVPSPAFTWSPTTPGQYDVVTFDASPTMLNGSACLDSCAYFWEFGDGISWSGRIAAHRYATSGTFSVHLTVISPDGVIVNSTRSVVVGAAAAITATITLSPTDPRVNDTVYFDAGSSSTPDGTAIVSYAWDFGNGSTATTSQATTTYTVARTYTIRLTIVDALGRTATTTRTVPIS